MEWSVDVVVAVLGVLAAVLGCLGACFECQDEDGAVVACCVDGTVEVKE